MKNQKKYKELLSRIFLSLFISTLGLYALIISAKYSGAEYDISDGEYFITWSILSVFVLLAINKAKTSK